MIRSLPLRQARLLWSLLLVLALAVMAAPVFAEQASAQTFPKLTGRVVDEANLLTPQQEMALDAKLAALEQQSQRQLVVATVPDLQGYEIEDYGYRLGRAWGIGSKERNDGAILLVAPNQRKVRIEVGYGLEGILTDALSSLIIQREIIPRFKQGDFAGGIAAATDQLIAQLQLPEDEARKVAQAAQDQASGSSNGDVGFWIWLILFVLLFVLPMLRRSRGGRRYGHPGVMIFPTGGWGSGGGGFGGGGFGGFSGGGGSFGGGGSSGNW